MPTERPPLLILGASARAAAHSAVRAGRRPICADRFADDDLLSVADVLPVDDYPRGLIAAARRAPPCPWLYTGALENHPDIVAAISQDRPLWGNPPDVLAAVRDPLWVESVLQAGGLPVLAVRPANDPPPPDGRWLRKPIRSAAGRKTNVWNRQASEKGTGPICRNGPKGASHKLDLSPFPIDEPYYFQQKAEGTPISALYLATARNTFLIGITRQFVGSRSCCAPPYTYCGSIGPIQLPQKVTRQIERTGEVLWGCSGLRGLFGVDLMLDSDTARLTEINPRYTASVEIFEHAWGAHLLDWHCRACASFGQTQEAARQASEVGLQPSVGQAFQPADWPWQAGKPAPRQVYSLKPGAARIVGKMIVYADRSLTMGSLGKGDRSNLCEAPFGPFRQIGPVPFSDVSVPAIADIPAPGTVIAAGGPVCTVFASDATRSQCQRKLTARVREMFDLLHTIFLEPAPNCR